MSKALCAWCKKNPIKEGYALCNKCYKNNETDEENWNKGKHTHFICPICTKDIGARTICPRCGIIRYTLMSLPSHCKKCDSKYWYHKNNDTTTKRYCWCCGEEFKESGIDGYIMFALQNFKQFEEWDKER